MDIVDIEIKLHGVLFFSKHEMYSLQLSKVSDLGALVQV